VYRVVVPAGVVWSLRRLPRKLEENAKRRIVALAETPRPSWAKSLQGSRLLRFRVGDYRVLFDVDDNERTVALVAVEHRSKVYRKL